MISSYRGCHKSTRRGSSGSPTSSPLCQERADQELWVIKLGPRLCLVLFCDLDLQKCVQTKYSARPRRQSVDRLTYKCSTSCTFFSKYSVNSTIEIPFSLARRAMAVSWEEYTSMMTTPQSCGAIRRPGVKEREKF